MKRGNTGTVSVASVRTPPEIGASVAGWTLRAAFVVVALGTAVVQLHAAFWIGLAVLLIAVAAFRPRAMTAWPALALIAASVLWQQPDPAWRFAAVLLGLHLTHVLAAWSLRVPIGALVQARVFARPLLRLVAVQVVVQAVALVMLHGAPAWTPVPVLGIVAAAALLALALVLTAPMVRERRRRE